jgi:hypothetical protein
VFASGGQYAGQYVSMKFDASGNLYLACYTSSTGDLIYLNASKPASPGTFDNANDYSFASKVVDESGSVGAWSDIALQGQVPHISYLNSSMIGTFDGIKHATWKTVATAPITTAGTTSVAATSLVGSNDITNGASTNYHAVFSDGQSRQITSFTKTTGTISWSTALSANPSGEFKVVDSNKWESEIAPCNAAVKDAQTGIEVKRNTGTAWTATWGDVALGYKSSRFELVSLRPEP